MGTGYQGGGRCPPPLRQQCRHEAELASPWRVDGSGCPECPAITSTYLDHLLQSGDNVAEVEWPPVTASLNVSRSGYVTPKYARMWRGLTGTYREGAGGRGKDLGAFDSHRQLEVSGIRIEKPRETNRKDTINLHETTCTADA